MGFFDLNIPYHESSASDQRTHKTAHLKTVVKAMKLGYTGIAYNRVIKGIMSDQDRCSISRLSLSSLLKVAPSLSSSVNFHRDLLGIPHASPFRQYMRLTVYADTMAKCQVLNSGNPVLKSYDLVAVRPLNQSAFDHACEKAEVDIISIEFSDKVPFKLKLPMVKAAVKRGVYFEISYSNLIVGVQWRRQMISNTKLLVDWTCGKNLILSSGASSVNEVRGPYDVVNLASLIGLTMERAKAALSRNCRTLLANALRKKHFHKETIKVEAISSDLQFDSMETWSQNLLKWDPISSGEGDLHLDDREKSFSASSKVPKTAKAIYFASVIDSIPAHGFQLKDLVSGVEAVPQSKVGGSMTSATEAIKVLDSAEEMSEKPSRLDVPPSGNDLTSLDNALMEKQSPEHEDTQKLDLRSSTEDMGTHTSTAEGVLKNPGVPSEVLSTVETERDNQHLQNSVSSCQINIFLRNEDTNVCNADASLNGVTPSDAFEFPCQIEGSKCAESGHGDIEAKGCAMSEDTMDIDIKDQEDAPLRSDTTTLQESEQCKEPSDDHVFSSKNIYHEPFEVKVAEESSVKNHDDVEVMKVSEQPHGVRLGEPGDVGLFTDHIPIPESCSEMTIEGDSSMTNLKAQDEFTNDGQCHGEKYRDPVDGATDQVQLVGPHNEIRFRDECCEVNWKVQEEKMEEQLPGEAYNEYNGPTLLQCTSGNGRKRSRLPHGGLLFPFPLKRLLSPTSFKKKGHRRK